MCEYMLTCVYAHRRVCSFTWGGYMDAQGVTLGKWRDCQEKKEKLQSATVAVGSLSVATAKGHLI